MKKKTTKKTPKCAVCGRSKVYWSIYSTADGKSQCTGCANMMRSNSNYAGAHPISGSPADKRVYTEPKTVFGWLRGLFN